MALRRRALADPVRTRHHGSGRPYVESNGIVEDCIGPGEQAPFQAMRYESVDATLLDDPSVFEYVTVDFGGSGEKVLHPAVPNVQVTSRDPAGCGADVLLSVTTAPGRPLDDLDVHVFSIDSRGLVVSFDRGSTLAPVPGGTTFVLVADAFGGEAELLSVRFHETVGSEADGGLPATLEAKRAGYGETYRARRARLEAALRAAR